MRTIAFRLCMLSTITLLTMPGEVVLASPPAALDPTFASNGILNAPSLNAIDAALQEDGKLLVLGLTNPDAGYVVLSRFNRDGSVDMSFGAAGVLRLTVNGAFFGASKLLPLDDERFLIAGATQQPCGPSVCEVAAVARFSVDGEADLSFGHAGIAALAYPAVKLVVRSDGSFVVLEDSSIHCGFGCVLISSSIEAFAADGTAVGTWANPCAAGLNDLAVQPDGKTVFVAAEGDVAHGLQTCVARFTFGGSLDSPFGTGGIRRISQSNGLPILLVDPRDPQDRVVVSAGYGGFDPAPPGAMIRLAANGDTDPAFGDPLNGHAAPTRAVMFALSCAHKFIGGYFVPAGSPPALSGIHLTRYNGNGLADTTFSGSSSGDIFTMLPNLDGGGGVFVQRLLVRDDGEIIVVGNVLPPLSPPNLVVAAYRQQDCMHPDDSGSLPVIEYHNASLDHYFMTASVDDMNALDSGQFQGWSRTGYTFSAGTTTPGLVPVCRFYIPPPYGDSHFFSASSAECADVARRFPPLVLESTDAMNVGLPDPATGACFAPTSMPVYRLWDNRVDTNHRYITDRAVRDTMVGLGWIAEGYGPDPVAMCALPQ